MQFRHIVENSENWNHRTHDIRDVVTISCHDSFIIGSTYAAKPYIPYYGHVRIINIIFSHFHANVDNTTMTIKSCDNNYCYITDKIMIDSKLR